MYSPKIREELIPRIYRIAKANKTRMTILVNGILKKVLDEMEGMEDKAEENGKLAAGCAEITAGILEKGRKHGSGKRTQKKAFDHCSGPVDQCYRICDPAQKRADGVRDNQNGRRRHNRKAAFPAPAAPGDSGAVHAGPGGSRVSPEDVRFVSE